MINVKDNGRSISFDCNDAPHASTHARIPLKGEGHLNGRSAITQAGFFSFFNAISFYRTRDTRPRLNRPSTADDDTLTVYADFVVYRRPPILD